jgi:hypothetical protein
MPWAYDETTKQRVWGLITSGVNDSEIEAATQVSACTIYRWCLNINHFNSPNWLTNPCGRPRVVTDDMIDVSCSVI